MTIDGQTAYRNAAPLCSTCLDTGTDLVFETPCTECAEAGVIAETRARIAERWRSRFPPRTGELTTSLREYRQEHHPRQPRKPTLWERWRHR